MPGTGHRKRSRRTPTTQWNVCRAALSASVFGFLSASAVAGDSAESLISKVDAIFAPWNKPDSPGCTCAAIKDREIIYAKGYGMADLEHHVPLTPDSVFYIASTTKQFTAASVGLLILDKKVSPETDIRTFFPELRNLTVPITVDQLIHHTSGIRDYLELLSLAGRGDSVRLNNDFVVKLLARQKALNFPPGSQYLYSNSNYVLLAEIVKRASGAPLPEFATARIFAPLGMEATRFGNNINEIVPNRVVSYSPKMGGGFFQFVKTIEAYGDGNLLTTVNDLARWDENFYTGRVGGTALLKLLQTRGILNDGKATNYGYGLMYEDYRGQPMVSHGGAFQGFRTELIRFPQQHFSVAVLCNLASVNPSNLARRVADVYLADQLAPVSTPAARQPLTEVKVDPKLLDTYIGSYALEGNPQFVVSFTREGDSFFTQAVGQPKFQMFPSSDDEFFLKVVDAQVTFHRDSDGHVGRLTLHQNGDHEARRVKVYQVPVAALNEYAGRYYSDELDVTYELAMDGDSLKVRNSDVLVASLKPSEHDVFALGAGYVAFHRDNKNMIDGLSYSTGRVLNLFFIRRSPQSH